MVPEIQSKTDRNFYFGPVFVLLPPPPPPAPPNDPKYQNFYKMKNISGDIIVLHMCTINEDHMMYGS